MKLNWKKSKLTIFGGITLVLVLYVLHDSINLNPLYMEGATFWCFVITAYVLAGVFLKAGSLFVQTMRSPDNANGPYKVVPKLNIPKWALWIVIIPWAFVIIMSIISSPLISFPAYRDQLGEPEVRDFSSDIQVMDMSQVPIVDKDLASRLADKKLGERPSLGSQVYLGEPTIQQVNGELIWVVPLQHSGFFMWLSNMDGTPGYITVSATNSNDVEYVENYKIKYQPYSYLFDDLTRYVRFTSALFTGITDYSFELDDAGQPHWVVTTFENVRGFALPEATGAIVVNASTGESVQYTIDNLPDWVDRVQPEQFIMNQINNQGLYVHGIFNFSNRDKFQSSEGDTIIYNGDNCYLFTGLTSVGSDESAIGFVMVDMVSKQSIRYQISGATEYSAQNSAEGKVQHLQYDASFPLILNVAGQPTYFMTLKDAEGLIKQYAFVSVENYSIVGTGETIRDASNDYTKSLGNDGSGSAFTEEDLLTVTGTVVRIASEFSGSETVYIMTIQEESGKIFTASSSVSSQLALTLPGDRVSLSYYDNSTELQNCMEFENLSM